MSEDQKTELLEAEVLRLRRVIRDYCREARAEVKKLEHDTRVAYLQSFAFALGVVVGWGILVWWPE